MTWTAKHKVARRQHDLPGGSWGGGGAHAKDDLNGILKEIGVATDRVREVADRLRQSIDARIEERFAAEHAASYGVVRLAASSEPEGVAQALEDGDYLRTGILQDPAQLTPEDAARVAGISREALNNRRKAGRALALKHIKRGYRYPEWQFKPAIADAVQAVLAELRQFDPWDCYFFFVETEPLLGGRRPLDLLLKGERDRVIEVARKLHQSAEA